MNFVIQENVIEETWKLTSSPSIAAFKTKLLSSYVPYIKNILGGNKNEINKQK
jgi:hypothetical protein